MGASVGAEKRMKRENYYRLKEISEMCQLNAMCRSCLSPYSNQPTIKRHKSTGRIWTFRSYVNVGEGDNGNMVYIKNIISWRFTC